MSINHPYPGALVYNTPLDHAFGASTSFLLAEVSHFGDDALGLVVPLAGGIASEGGRAMIIPPQV